MPEKSLGQTSRLIGLAVLLPCLFAAAQIDLPTIWGTFRGDSAVYYAMAQSLAWDRDLKYTREDLERITREWPQGPEGILLVASDTNPNDIRYAKPFLYSLAGAPLVRFFDSNGLLVLNVLCFALILWIGFRAFRTDPDRPLDGVAWTLVFWGLTAVPAYLFTLTPEIFNAALVMAGLWPWIEDIRRAPERQDSRLLLISGAILGIATLNRPPVGLFLLVPCVELLRRIVAAWRDRMPHRLRAQLLTFILFGLAAAAGIAFVFLIGYLLTGQLFSHAGFRKRIVGHFPFESPQYHFLNTGSMISTRNTRFIFHWDILRDNLVYFFIGRHTGLIPYFLPAAVSILLGFRLPGKAGPHRGTSPGIRWSVLAVAIGQILFHLVYIPSNYHGGSCSVGNRYLISYLPCLFLLPPVAPKRRTILATALVTGLLSGAIALNPLDSMSAYQHVGKRMILDRFLLETTLLNSWPGDDAAHTRVPFDSFHAYFADDNQWGREGDGFWVRGARRMSAVLRFWKRPEAIVLEIRNGDTVNRIRGRLGNRAFDLRMQPGETASLDLSPSRAKPFYNLEGSPSYCYALWIEPSDGFVPRFSEPFSTDGRYLGCYVRMSGRFSEGR